MAQRTVFRLLLALVVLAPLPLGSYRPWAWSVLGVGVGGLLIAWVAAVLTRQAGVPVPLRRLSWAAVPFTTVLLWALAQTVALAPSGWCHPLWSEAGGALGVPVSGAISLDPQMTRTAAFRLLSYGGVFWLAAQLGCERSRARLALVTVAVAETAYALYGLIVHFLGWERILWLPKWAYPGDLTATFVNRNAYGAYAGLGMLCCLALFLHTLRRRHRNQSSDPIALAETLLLGAVPALIGIILIGTALLLSHSRGAFISTIAAAAALLAATAATRMVRPRNLVVCTILLGAVALGVLGVSGEGTVQRLADTPTLAADEARPNLYRLTIQAIGDAPLTGYGLGAFLPAFRLYRDTSLSSPLVWDFAHDIYLETAFDLGLPMAALLMFSVAVVVASCVRGLKRRRRDHVYPALAVAAAVLLGGHGIVDFSAQMPAIAVTLALLLGIGYAQSWPAAENGSS